MDSRHSSAHTQARITRADGSPIRAVVVDDEDSLTDLLSMALRYEGWDVRIAPDGQKALSITREFRPDVIVLDVMLPDIDGMQVLTRLRADGIQTPVLFLTAKDALDDRNDQDELQDRGVHLTQRHADDDAAGVIRAGDEPVLAKCAAEIHGDGVRIRGDLCQQEQHLLDGDLLGVERVAEHGRLNGAASHEGADRPRGKARERQKRSGWPWAAGIPARSLGDFLVAVRGRDHLVIESVDEVAAERDGRDGADDDAHRRQQNENASDQPPAQREAGAHSPGFNR